MRQEDHKFLLSGKKKWFLLFLAIRCTFLPEQVEVHIACHIFEVHIACHIWVGLKCLNSWFRQIFYSNFTLDRFEEFQNKISLLANKEQLSLANSWILFWDIQVKHKLKWYEALWILQVLKHINFKLLQCGVSWCFAYGNVFIPIAIKAWKITRHLLFWLMMVLLNDKKVNFVTEKKKKQDFLTFGNVQSRIYIYFHLGKWDFSYIYEK